MSESQENGKAEFATQKQIDELRIDFLRFAGDIRAVYGTLETNLADLSKSVCELKGTISEHAKAQAEHDALVASDLAEHGAALARTSRRQAAIAAATDATAVLALGILAYLGTLSPAVACTAILAVVAGRLHPKGHGGALLSLLPDLSAKRSDPPPKA